MARYTIEDGYRGRRSIKRPIVVLSLFSCLIIGGFIIQNKSPTVNKIVSPVSPSVQAAPSALELTRPLTWPSYGRAAYGVAGQGVLANSTSENTSVPTASTAKIITALAVLKHRPLKLGEQGPAITITQEDIAIYENYVRNDGSVVPVELGMQLSQYQALQAMLLPSANNISDALVRWAFGSNEAYIQYANQMLKDLQINDTVVADASGFSVSTKSTASDLTRLALIYVQNPVLKEIAQQPQATIPFAGVIKNYNSVVNKDRILGIKIGYTDEAGRCFVVVDLRDGVKPTSAATVMGAGDLLTAMNDAVSVINSGNAAYDDAAARQP